jgi:hypothetical protein
LPLAIEMSRLEQEASREAEIEIQQIDKNTTHVKDPL